MKKSVKLLLATVGTFSLIGVTAGQALADDHERGHDPHDRHFHHHHHPHPRPVIVEQAPVVYAPPVVVEPPPAPEEESSGLNILIPIHIH